MKTDLHRMTAPRPRNRAPRRPDVICLSHLRWDFVFQRPQHLLSRCARQSRVFFVEEPVNGVDYPVIEVREAHPGVRVAVPRLPDGLDEEQGVSLQRRLLGEMLRRHEIEEYVLWYYTPMALPFTRHLTPRAVVYDCMDELSSFAGAHERLREHEAELLRRSHLVLTGGHSLYEAKRHHHHNIHPLPSSVDVQHFARARKSLPEPPDQARIPHPRLGFFGVIDERMDTSLLAEVAKARRDWQIVLVGPTVKIDPAALPALPNIHYLGKKTYDELPSYLSGWDVALLPFARNAATRFISPTKTPEYLAACKPVVSTSIRDVVRPYGELGLVHIADEPRDFVRAIEACLAEERGALATHQRAVRQARIEGFLAHASWDDTWARAHALLAEALRERQWACRGS
jgi:glycosyltransferase involved in cell wall biosynthesis